MSDSDLTRDTPTPAELEELARRAPGRLSQRLAGVELRLQAELALRLPPQERLEVVLHAPEPMKLVRALPDSEAYLTIREVGPNDALPMIALTSASQLQHLLDLESWRGEDYDPLRAGAWIALLLEAGEPTLRRLLRSISDEELTLLFQSWIRVSPILPEDEVEGQHGHGMTESGDELGIMSPDGYYRFRPSLDQHAAAIHRMTAMLYVEQRERYTRIVWDALYQLPAEVEEQARQWRQSRLEEHGYPPLDEARSVYRPPQGTRSAAGTIEPEAPIPPRTPLALPMVQVGIGPAIERLPRLDQERAMRELVALGNRILIADAGDTGDPAARIAALEKSAATIHVALEARNAAEPSRAAETIARVPLIELFREGHEQAAVLQRRAHGMRRDGWAAAHPQALSLLDTPIRERIEALLFPCPAYFDVGEGATEAGVRPFQSMSEIRETAVALQIAEMLGRLFVERLGLDVAAVLDSERPERAESARFSTFLLTLLAWHAVRGEIDGSALPPATVASFLERVASERAAPPEAPRLALAALGDELERQLRLTADDRALFDAFGRACLLQLAQECRGLDPALPVDPRYVSCLLIEPEKH